MKIKPKKLHSLAKWDLKKKKKHPIYLSRQIFSPNNIFWGESFNGKQQLKLLALHCIIKSCGFIIGSAHTSQQDHLMWGNTDPTMYKCS